MKIKKHNSRRIKGKLRVSHYLSSNDKLRKYVPHTVLFTKPNLIRLTEHYQSLYIKLDIGSMGIGVYKLQRIGNKYKLYWTQSRKQITRSYNNLSQAYHAIKAMQKKKMIIQKAISLDQIKGRPYDIRVMVQRKPGKAWNCTGFLIKLGARNKIVTNYYQGGTILTLDQLLKLKKMTGDKKRKIKYKLSNTALNVTKSLSKKRSGMHEMGIDFALDKYHRLWILEVNSNYPQYHPLKYLNKKMYDRIKLFAKSYGRFD